MRKLTESELKQCKRDFKVLGISSLAYLAIVAILSAIFSFASVGQWVAPLFFACLWIVDKRL